MFRVLFTALALTASTAASAACTDSPMAALGCIIERLAAIEDKVDTILDAVSDEDECEMFEWYDFGPTTSIPALAFSTTRMRHSPGEAARLWFDAATLSGCGEGVVIDQIALFIENIPAEATDIDYAATLAIGELDIETGCRMSVSDDDTKNIWCEFGGLSQVIGPNNVEPGGITIYSFLDGAESEADMPATLYVHWTDIETGEGDLGPGYLTAPAEMMIVESRFD